MIDKTLTIKLLRVMYLKLLIPTKSHSIEKTLVISLNLLISQALYSSRKSLREKIERM